MIGGSAYSPHRVFLSMGLAISALTRTRWMNLRPSGDRPSASSVVSVPLPFSALWRPARIPSRWGRPPRPPLRRNSPKPHWRRRPVLCLFCETNLHWYMTVTMIISVDWAHSQHNRNRDQWTEGCSSVTQPQGSISIYRLCSILVIYNRKERIG